MPRSVVALAFGVLLAFVVQPSLALGASWAPGVKATPPAGAGSNPRVDPVSVSCASAGNCSAVGYYYDSSGNQQGFLSAETSGTWTAGVKATLPAGAGSNPHAYLASVSCASVGNCSAVGSYQDSSGHSQGLVLIESSGIWTGTTAPLPAGAGANPSASLSRVSCTSAGSCTAVGSYQDSSGHSQGLLLSESLGSWTAAEATPPGDAGANPLLGLSSVSCASAGNCVAIGSYHSLTGSQALLASETSGTWSTAIRPPLPADAGTIGGHGLDSVSCPSAGNCAATGHYYDSSMHPQGLLLSESSGTWTATKSSLPADAATIPNGDLVSVSCTAAGNCTAVGYYNDSSGHSQGLLVSESANVWSGGIKAALPAGAGTDPSLSVSSVSCASAGNCSAVGSYNDSAGNEQGLLLNETGGAWARGVKATLPTGAGSNPEVNISSVSCVSAGNCSAVGSYKDTSGNQQGLLLATAQRLTVSRAGPGSGAVRSSPSGISCPRSCLRSYPSGTQVTLTAAPAARSFFKGWSGACTGAGGCTVTMSAARTVTATFKLHLPDTKISKSKINRKRRTAKFNFKAIGVASGFECALVRQAKKHHKQPKPKFSRCSSPKSYSHLKPGRHAFLVRAVNATGHDRTPAKRSFKI